MRRPYTDHPLFLDQRIAAEVHDAAFDAGFMRCIAGLPCPVAETERRGWIAADRVARDVAASAETRRLESAS